MQSVHLTLRLTHHGSVLIFQQELDSTLIDGYTGEHLLRSEEGFAFQIDHVEHIVSDENEAEQMILDLSQPVDEEGLHRDPVMALLRHGWREQPR